MRMRARVQTSDLLRQLADDQRVAVVIFSMLADPTRVRLLWCLLGGEYAVNELAKMMTGCAPSAASQHLAKLRLDRLVRDRGEGRHVQGTTRWGDRLAEQRP
jgi:DNA-binding transcriptional ArsR family regulator